MLAYKWATKNRERVVFMHILNLTRCLLRAFANFNKKSRNHWVSGFFYCLNCLKI